MGYHSSSSIVQVTEYLPINYRKNGLSHMNDDAYTCYDRYAGTQDGERDEYKVRIQRELKGRTPSTMTDDGDYK